MKVRWAVRWPIYACGTLQPYIQVIAANGRPCTSVDSVPPVLFNTREEAQAVADSVPRYYPTMARFHCAYVVAKRVP